VKRGVHGACDKFNILRGYKHKCYANIYLYTLYS